MGIRNICDVCFDYSVTYICTGFIICAGRTSTKQKHVAVYAQ